MDSSKASTSAKSSKQKKHHWFSEGEKQMILNSFNSLSEQYKEKSKSAVVFLVSNTLKISERSVYNVLKEQKTFGELSPAKKPSGRVGILASLDDLDKSAIRRKVHSFFFQGEPPTLDKVLNLINEDPDLPNLSRTTLYRLLLSMNFRYCKRSRNSLLIEKDEITLWRRRYLKEIRKHREDGKTIYYLDETWITEGYTQAKVWKDEAVASTSQAFKEGLSTGLKNPSGAGKRLIILHIGSKNGFVEDGLLVFESKKTADYHEEMNGKVFEEWFSSIINKLDDNAVIVMDNAPYHSRKIERIPTNNWKKEDIKSWLREKNVVFDENLLKVELLGKVKEVKSNFDLYVIDEMAKSNNKIVLRLPPYHCELNPIELIWAQIKGYVARNNKTFKLPDVKKLFHESVALITKEKWENCVKHVEEVVEKKMWDVDNIIEDIHERIIINLQESSSSSDDDLDLS